MIDNGLRRSTHAIGRVGAGPHPEENRMDDETLNLSIRKFLKMVGVNSQREIEQAVAKAVSAGNAPDTCPATMTLEIPALGLKVEFDGNIALR